MDSPPRAVRFGFIALAGLSLLIALWSGLTRLGWELPKPNVDFDSLHGPLMTVGFLATLIGLERAAAVGRWWVYGIPFFSVLSVAALLVDAPPFVVALSAFFSATLLLFFFVGLYRIQPAEHFVVMTLSAAALGVGNIVWLAEAPLAEVAPWWSGFLVLTIAGERLELARIRRPPLHIRVQFWTAVVVVLIGLTTTLFSLFPGVRIAGVGLLALGLWLLRYDLAWQNLTQPGLPRFMASCLIVGYLWLAGGGVLWIVFAGFFVAGPIYDAMLHTVFVGFVISMIFAHGPVILPTITGMKLPFQDFFYLHAALLHVGLMVRIAGDFDWLPWGRKWGGALNVLAILLFLLNNARALKLADRG
jgi:hypothetical protein